MYQKDYILRELERISILIAGILGLIKKGDLTQASFSIDKAYTEILKEDAAFFNKIPLDDLTENLMQEHHYTHGHLEILSELFYAQGELFYAREDQTSSLPYYQRSLKLLQFISKKTGSYSLERQARIDHIFNRLSGH